MMSFLKTRAFLIIVLILFVALKIPHLHYAYYWDESWPYAIAIKEMYHHGISLMPNAIDAELSRGHPLFFHAVAAGWMHIFGDSHIAMHSLALLISVLFLIAIYEAGLRLFNQRVAIIALLMTAAFEMFFVQSAMVLFEVPVAFLCFLSLIFYIRDKFWLTALCLSMLFYTKESGMIMGFVLGIDALVGFFKKDTPIKTRILRIVSIAIPVVLIGIYFVVQKQVQGWYIFPYYAGLVPHEWNYFWYSFRMTSLYATFYDHYRHYTPLLLILLAAVAAIKQKKTWPLSILLPAICLYYFIDDKRAGRIMPSIPFFIVFTLSVIFFVYQYAKQYGQPQRKLIVLIVAFIFCFSCFSAMNFFTPRYLLASIIPLFFLMAIFFDMFISMTYSWLSYVVIAGLIVISATVFLKNDFHGDGDMGAFDGLTVHQAVVDYFEKNVQPEAQIATGLFLESQHLSSPATGFLHSQKAFKNVRWDIDAKTQYVIFDNIEQDDRYESFKKDSSFRLEHKIESGKVWAEIYKRK